MVRVNHECNTFIITHFFHLTTQTVLRAYTPNKTNQNIIINILMVNKGLNGFIP